MKPRQNPPGKEPLLSVEFAPPPLVESSEDAPELAQAVFSERTELLCQGRRLLSAIVEEALGEELQREFPSVQGILLMSAIIHSGSALSGTSDKLLLLETMLETGQI
jgi:hypothetical protein